jgi:hypothetical protein
MNRKNLTAAVLAGLAGVVGIAGSAQAVNINPDGTGQVLLYPYYTTNGGNITLLSVVNTSDNAKAVKVRFMESENSAEVLDFNLYMSAYDVWTAAINPMPDDADYDCQFDPQSSAELRCEGPLLTIAADETTCTVPALNGAQPFLPYEYMTAGGGDEGSQTMARMNEGHFEMLEMGTLITGETCSIDAATGDFVVDPDGTLDCPSWAGLAATHVEHPDGSWAPEACDELVAAWVRSKPFFEETSGVWINTTEYGPTYGVEAPSGGLFGGAAIVNPMQGSMHSYDATALNGWNESGFEFTAGEVDSIHAEPGTIKPNLESGDVYEGLVFGEDGSLLESGEFMFPIDAVSYVLMHDTLMNEYTTETGVAGQTEWVVTFPTKRFYVNDFDFAIKPFTTVWKPITKDALATACEQVELNKVWDREERFEKPGDQCDPEVEICDITPPVVSPPKPGNSDDVEGPGVGFELCYETNVIRFGLGVEKDGDDYVDITPDATEILGTPKGFYRNIDNESLGFQYGWARIEMDDYLEAKPLEDDNGDIYGYTYKPASRLPLVGQPTEDVQRPAPLNGLPFIGFAVTRFSNGFIPVEGGQDVFSSYGGLFKHKSSRKVGSNVEMMDN